MSIALFVSEQYLLENSVINENVAYTQIRPTLVKVQDMHIQPALGSALYQQVQGQVVSGSVSALNTTLLEDYMQMGEQSKQERKVTCEWVSNRNKKEKSHANG